MVVSGTVTSQQRSGRPPFIWATEFRCCSAVTLLPPRCPCLHVSILFPQVFLLPDTGIPFQMFPPVTSHPVPQIWSPRSSGFCYPGVLFSLFLFGDILPVLRTFSFSNALPSKNKQTHSLLSHLCLSLTSDLRSANLSQVWHWPGIHSERDVSRTSPDPTPDVWAPPVQLRGERRSWQGPCSLQHGHGWVFFVQEREKRG